MKKNKGEVGYIDYQKKRSLLFSLSGIGIFVIMYLIGYFIYRTNANLLTLISVLLVLPASQFITKYVLLSRYKSGSFEIYNKLNSMSKDIVILCDLLLVRNRSTRYFEFTVINGSDLLMLTKNKKGKDKEKTKDRSDVKSMVEQILKSKGFTANVKVFNNNDDFLNYLSNKSLNKGDQKQNELARQLLLNSV